MFGENPVTKPFRQEDGSLLVTEAFQTVQGEGPDAGTPAVFVRLSRCNLKCFWCDTQFDTGEWWTPNTLLGHVQNLAGNYQIGLVVITGGEPLLQNLLPFISLCNRAHLRVSIESAGTLWEPNLTSLFSNGINRLIISPKTPKLNPDALRVVSALKYIISADNSAEDDGLPILSTQIPGKMARIYRHDRLDDVVTYVQPMDTGNPEKNKLNMEHTAKIAMKFGYRLSLQTHKIVGLP